MSFQWTSWAIPGLLGSLIAWSATIVVLRTAPGRSLNRRLALVLALEATWQLGFVLYMVREPQAVVRIASFSVGAMAAIPFHYLAFLGVAIDTPLTRPFRGRIGFSVLATLSVLVAGWIAARPGTFIGDVYSPPWAASNFLFTTWGARLAQFHGLASLFGLIASLWAWRRAPKGSARRSHALWFAIAFGVRDLYNAGWWLFYPLVRSIPFWGDWVSNQAIAYVSILYVLLMAYGVLRVQLFDIDLKVKFVLTQGVLGGVIAAAFFVGSELLESVIPVEGTTLGLLSAGVIVLALRPLQRFAQIVAARAMPGVEDTPEYRTSRKRDVYRATLEGVFEDGDISDRERRVLAHLREQLGLSDEAGARLEAEVRSRLAPAPSG